MTCTIAVPYYVLNIYQRMMVEPKYSCYVRDYLIAPVQAGDGALLDWTWTYQDDVWEEPAYNGI